jgi:hypothetical protein
MQHALTYRGTDEQARGPYRRLLDRRVTGLALNDVPTILAGRAATLPPLPRHPSMSCELTTAEAGL